MDLKELRDNLLRLLWLEQEATVPAYIFEDVTTAINSALQLMWTTPKDYFRSQELTATITSGSTSVDLPDTVQEVIGPVWIPADGKELQRVTDQSDWEQFWQRFYGQSSAPTSMIGQVLFYFLKKRNQAGTDNAKVTLEIKSSPTVDTDISYVASTEPTIYEVSTINSLTGTETIGVPHQYVESLLLPIARWMTTRSHFFFEKDKLPLIEQDAARALQMLDLADPELGTQSMMSKRIRSQTAQAER